MILIEKIIIMLLFLGILLLYLSGVFKMIKGKPIRVFHSYIPSFEEYSKEKSPIKYYLFLLFFSLSSLFLLGLFFVIAYALFFK